MAEDQEDYRHMYTHRGFTDAFEVLYTSMQCVIQRLQVGSLFSLRMTISPTKHGGVQAVKQQVLELLQQRVQENEDKALPPLEIVCTGHSLGGDRST